jgi:hypothetical protein
MQLSPSNSCSLSLKETSMLILGAMRGETRAS